MLQTRVMIPIYRNSRYLIFGYFGTLGVHSRAMPRMGKQGSVRRCSYQSPFREPMCAASNDDIVTCESRSNHTFSTQLTEPAVKRCATWRRVGDEGPHRARPTADIFQKPSTKECSLNHTLRVQRTHVWSM